MPCPARLVPNLPRPVSRLEADVIVVGAGLAGLTATAELADAGQRVLLLDQEPEASLGGQAFWSLGGLFLVDTPEQRRWGIKDSLELAWQDWLGSAGLRPPRGRVAAALGARLRGVRRRREARLAARPGRARARQTRAGRSAAGATRPGTGTRCPRFHITWGTGPGLLEPFVRRVREAQARGLVTYAPRHRVDALTVSRRRGDGRQRLRARAERRGARRGQLARGGGRVRGRRPGRR